MSRKKILLLGLSQDKKAFLDQLKRVKNERNVYKVDSELVEILTTIEQIRPDHICSKSLNGFDAVIQLFNDKDEMAPSLQILIPDAIPSYVKVLGIDNETSADYVKKLLSEIHGKSAYCHQEPTISVPSVASFFSSLFCAPRKREAVCPQNHTSNQPFECSALSYVISSK